MHLFLTHSQGYALGGLWVTGFGLVVAAIGALGHCARQVKRGRRG